MAEYVAEFEVLGPWSLQTSICQLRRAEQVDLAPVIRAGPAPATAHA
jgi:hypothetical protein